MWLMCHLIPCIINYNKERKNMPIMSLKNLHSKICNPYYPSKMILTNHSLKCQMCSQTGIPQDSWHFSTCCQNQRQKQMYDLQHFFFFFFKNSHHNLICHWQVKRWHAPWKWKFHGSKMESYILCNRSNHSPGLFNKQSNYVQYEIVSAIQKAPLF